MNKPINIIGGIRLIEYPKSDDLLLDVPQVINPMRYTTHKRIFVEYIGPYIGT